MTDHDLPTLALEVSRLLRRAGRCMASPAVSPMLHLALLAIREEPDLTMRQFADAMRISPSTATACVDRMAKKGIVRRRIDPKNRRIIRLSLTPRGLNALNAYSDGQRAAFTDVFSALGEDDRRELARLFHTVLNRHSRP